MNAQPTVIVFALFPGVTQLDFTGPHAVFSRLPGAQVLVASRTGEPIEADGITFAGLRRLADIPRCDVICVPGGFGATDNAIGDEEFLRELRRLAASARYITSVCTGSLVLGAAGLLRGKPAACHWAWRDFLTSFGAVPDTARVVRDGNVITGGGVTAGIDLALTVAAEAFDEDLARSIQLSIEYDPHPPFDAGSPERADAALVEQTRAAASKRQSERQAAVDRAAARLR